MDRIQDKDNERQAAPSDTVLCALALALILVTLFAISITQNGGVQANRNKFSGGMVRPSFYLECTVPDFGKTTSDELALQRKLYAGLPYVAVHLFNPPVAQTEVNIREREGDEAGKDTEQVQQQDLSLYQFMQLAPGIDPGAFSAGGQRTALLSPAIMDRQMLYEPQKENGYRVNADGPLTKRLLAALWPVYRHVGHPDRRPDDYGDVRARIYVETMTIKREEEEDRYLVIGHLSYKFPEALNDGSLAWLAGFSSGLTEIVYLGETWSDPVKRTNKRIEFLRENGYSACADAYADYAFTQKNISTVDAMHEKLIEAGSSAQDIGRKAREAAAQVEVSEALLEGVLEKYSSILYPPLLAYPDAWAAYTAHHEAELPEPPTWFYRLFLNRLGFDRMAIE